MATNALTRFITFYSYKGGVGRTLALANCARALAADGKRVAILDLDLEAPGLGHFEVFHPNTEPAPERGGRRPPPPAGFAEYIAACRDAGPPERLKDAFFHRCRGLDGDKGEVWIMPAGRPDSDAYREVLTLNWKNFYGQEDGYRLVENLRGHIVDELRPDYVLLDARTGLTELGGIATHQIADLVVLLFNLNRQNLEGIRLAHDSLSNCHRPPLLLLVASPIPPMPVEAGTPFDERMVYVRDHLANAKNADQPVVIPYQPVLAWEERILVDGKVQPFDYDVPYRRLLDLILKTLDAPEVFLAEARRLRQDNKVLAAIATLDAGLEANPDARELWKEKRDLLALEEAQSTDPEQRSRRREQIETVQSRLRTLEVATADSWDARDTWLKNLEFLRVQVNETSDPRQRFTLDRAIADLEARLAALEQGGERVADLRPAGVAPGGRSAAPGTRGPGARQRVEVGRLPRAFPHFTGRESDLAWLDSAWFGRGQGGSGSATGIVALAAPAGTGKTALVRHWLDRLADADWGGADWVFGWTFQCQGAGDDPQAYDDDFLNEALAWCDVVHDPAASPWDKGRLLAQAVAARRTLLVLDGCEVLQYPAGECAGYLRTPGVKALLHGLAREGQPGLTLLTLRVPPPNLAVDMDGAQPQGGGVEIRPLADLSEDEGARLLHDLGCAPPGAGERPQGPHSVHEALRTASAEVGGQALTLGLMGCYVKQAVGGDIGRRPRPSGRSAGAPWTGVLEAFETWFRNANGAVELAVMRLLGLFDRPADYACVRELARNPIIPGLTEPLVNLADDDWRAALERLVDCGLIAPPAEATAWPEGFATIETHPLVRAHWGAALRESCQDAWRTAHKRLFDYLSASVNIPHRPDGLAGLQPLYRAVAHGCLAGQPRDAFKDIYIERILRGIGPDGFYSWKRLGAFGANLNAVACFFETPWAQFGAGLESPDQAWLLNEAALHLRALGRQSEALEPMRAGLEVRDRQRDWRNAAVSASNLSELELVLGRVSDAVAHGEQSRDYADRSRDPLFSAASRTALADALHQRGQPDEARRYFAEAEQTQANLQHRYALLSAAQGFKYCDLLLADAERAAWRILLARQGDHRDLPPARSARHDGADQVSDDEAACNDVIRRATQTLDWAKETRFSLLTIARDHLTLGRAQLFIALLAPQRRGPALERAAAELAAAVDGLRAAGDQSQIPLGRLPRALLHSLRGDQESARCDLDEAWHIARRDGMRLAMADCHLYRARLFRDRGELEAARELIADCGYGRRREELEDAERAAEHWPSSPGPTV